MVVCRYGQQCRNQRCTFEHARYGPCRFGAACINQATCPCTHPGAGNNCKYGAACNRADCQRAHPPGRPPPCAQGRDCHLAHCPLLHPAAVAVACRFAAACTKPNCPYVHPAARAAPVAAAQAAPAAAAQAAPAADAANVCKFGGGCTNVKCTFVHPEDRPAACPSGIACWDASCALLHPKRNLCQRGADCDLFECAKTHAPGRTAPCAAAAGCQDPACALLHPVRPLCRNGADCPYATCTYQHPPERPEPCPNDSGCRYSNCPLLHTPGKRPPACHNGARCRYGAECRFLHAMSAAQLERLEQQRRAQAEAAVEATRQRVERLHAGAEAELREQRRLLELARQGRQEFNTCNICLEDEVRAVEGLVCQGLHFVCDTCFDMHVRTVATRDDRLARGADVRCPCPECPARVFSAKQVAEHVQEATLDLLNALKKDLLELQVIHETEERVKEQLERERRRQAELSAVERAAKAVHDHVVENLLTLKCPRCKVAFVDFDGCFALTCSNCPCGFCAWCLKDCGTDAHACAAECGLKYNGHGYFGTKQQFEEHHRARNSKLVQAYLDKQPADVRQAATQLLHRQLHDLGLPPAAADPHLARARQQHLDHQLALALDRNQ